MKLSILHQLFYFVILITVNENYVQGKARIIQVPPNPMYVVSGETARLVWDYTVDNRKEEFQLISPTWSHYYANETPLLIGYDHVLRDWRWTISNDTCPARLLYPTTRVSRESNATLVISNVTTADSGIYWMNLLMKTLPPIGSKIQLLVTTRPKFTSQFQANNKVLEGEDLGINCSATGNPTPNITWVLLKNQAKEIKSQGVGFANLVIQNITRHQNGTYQCQATNNPNEYPVKTQTQVTVWYKPNITFLNWTVNEKIIVLLCQASGHPRPLIKWYYADGTQVESGVTEITGGSRMVLKIPDSNTGLYGMYKCNATNEVGWKVGYLNITEIDLPATKIYTEKTVTVTSKPDTKTKANSVARKSSKPSMSTTKFNKDVAPTFESLGRTPNCNPALSYIAFYQGRTFAIINMSTTCVLFIIIAVLLTYIYVKCKRNSLKLSDNREEITRFSRPLVNRTENEDTSVVAVTIMRHSAPNEVLAENAPKITSSNEDYERISEKSESSFDAGNAEQGTSTSDVQHSQNHHNYQELNIDALLSNMQGYQALNRTIGDSARGVELPLYIRKYEALNFVHNPQSSEYQKLHLYANIDGKK